MHVQPAELKLADPETLEILWSDGQRRRYPVAQLRADCPCASCLEKRRAPPAPPEELPVLNPAEAQPLRIISMEPTGHYAYSIRFSDGHDTGLYTLEQLLQTGNADNAT